MKDSAPNSGDNGDRNRRQAELVAALTAGDKAALAALYDELSTPLYSVAYRMLHDAAEAQDLIQDIFLQLWQSSATYETSRGSVFSWLLTLTRNRAIDRLRMRRRRTELIAGAAPELAPQEPPAQSDGRGALGLREEAAAVRSALAGLSPEQQQALELAYFSGLTQQEIAERLKEPLGTIKARIRRGLRQLRERLPVQP